MSLSVSSEIYVEQNVNASSLELQLINVPLHENVSVDEDGDLIIKKKNYNIILDIDQSTKLKGVGLQLWRGAFLLADYIIHNKSQVLLKKNVLELGTGVGLTSIVASMFAQTVTPTDIDECGILERIRGNFNKNAYLVNCPVMVLELNFLNSNWSPELTNQINNADVILAADVIYDNDVTEAFADTLAKIMSTSKKTALIALEKRYVFTLDDLDTVAPCYEHFLSYLKHSWNKEPMSKWRVQLVNLDFPKYLEYDRNRHLILWKIES